MKTTNKLNYTITFKNGGHVQIVQVQSSNIKYAIDRACEIAEYEKGHTWDIVSIEAKL